MRMMMRIVRMMRRTRRRRMMRMGRMMRRMRIVRTMRRMMMMMMMMLRRRRRRTSFRDEHPPQHPHQHPHPSPGPGGNRHHHPPPGAPPQGLIYQAKRHRTHPNTYFALKQRKLQLENSSFRDYQPKQGTMKQKSLKMTIPVDSHCLISHNMVIQRPLSEPSPRL